MTEVRDKLRAWTLADELVLEIYAMTRKLPAEEPGDLPAALRGAAIRSALRLVQGVHGRRDEFDLAVCSALGSLAELRYYLYLSRRLGLIDLRRYRAVCARHEKVQSFLRDLRAVREGSRDSAAAPARTATGDLDRLTVPLGPIETEGTDSCAGPRMTPTPTEDTIR